MELRIDPRIFDAFPGVRADLVALVERFCGGRLARHQLCRDRPEAAASG